nr:quinate 5-dehydrogenase [Desulfolucanica intricata]
MKRVVSVSLGSSKRDHSVLTELLGQRIYIERIGVDGDIKRAENLLEQLDGRVSAIGLGGVNFNLQTGRYCFPLRDGIKLARRVKKTPLVDGSGLKSGEKRLISFLQKNYGWPRGGQRVLLTSALDRFGLGEALEKAGCRILVGDAIFALGIPLPFYSLRLFELAALLTVPFLSCLPVKWLYPTGGKQLTTKKRFTRYYLWADIIAGDFHFLHRYLPENLSGKDIITSTVTKENKEELKFKGVRCLVTTGPSFEGRSFGANVMEAVCVALLGLSREELNPEKYPPLLDELGWKPRVEYLN